MSRSPLRISLNTVQALVLAMSQGRRHPPGPYMTRKTKKEKERKIVFRYRGNSWGHISHLTEIERRAEERQRERKAPGAVESHVAICQSLVPRGEPFPAVLRPKQKRQGQQLIRDGLFQSGCVTFRAMMPPFRKYWLSCLLADVHHRRDRDQPAWWDMIEGRANHFPSYYGCCGDVNRSHPMEGRPMGRGVSRLSSFREYCLGNSGPPSFCFTGGRRPIVQYHHVLRTPCK